MGASQSGGATGVEVGAALPTEGTHLARLWSDVFVGQSSQRRQRVTVFLRQFAETDSKETREFYECGLKTLKQLRHPCILSFVDASTSSSEVFLVTERAQPLELALDGLEPVEVLAGLCSILDALVFVEERALLTHNNVCPSAIFVAADGTWKLSAFECARPLDKSRHWVMTDFAKTVKESAFTAPEDLEIMSQDVPYYARDSFGFGKLVEFLLPSVESALSDGQKEEIDEALSSLINNRPTLRPKLSGLVHQRLFRNTLTTVYDFLRNIQLKTAEEKATFFENLAPLLRSLPPAVVARRLCKHLLSRCVILEPAAQLHLFPAILQPKTEDAAESGGVLRTDAFERFVVPELLKICRVHERCVRLALLSHLPSYARAFSSGQLAHVVLPELLVGMRDADDALVAASLHALAHLVPILGGAAVTGLQHDKFFAEGSPRANTLPAEMCKNVKDVLQSSSTPSAHATPNSEPLRQNFGETEGERPSDSDWPQWDDDGAAPSVQPPAAKAAERAVSVGASERRPSSDQLGAEFEVAAADDTLDFFSDMAPKIQPKALRLLPASPIPPLLSDSDAKQSGRFAIASASEEVADNNSWDSEDIDLVFDQDHD